MGKAKKSALKAQCAPIRQRVRDRQNLIAVHCLEKTNDHFTIRAAALSQAEHSADRRGLTHAKMACLPRQPRHSA
jgi:hypothetical protein